MLAVYFPLHTMLKIMDDDGLNKKLWGGGARGRGRYGLAFENSFVRLSLPCAGSKA